MISVNVCGCFLFLKCLRVSISGSVCICVHPWETKHEPVCEEPTQRCVFACAVVSIFASALACMSAWKNESIYKMSVCVSDKRRLRLCSPGLRVCRCVFETLWTLVREKVCEKGSDTEIDGDTHSTCFPFHLNRGVGLNTCISVLSQQFHHEIPVGAGWDGSRAGWKVQTNISNLSSAKENL